VHPAPQNRQVRSQTDIRLARAVFVATFALYLLSSGREPPWGDGNVQYMVADGLVHHGSPAIPRPWPDDLPRGRNGKYYATYPLGASLSQLPAVLLLDAVTAVSPEARTLAKPLITHLACSAFGALTCVVFFWLCRERQLSRRAASAATAVLAFGTTIWVYAHYSYSEIAQAALFTGFVRELLRVRDEPTPGHARWLGLYAGLLFSVKYVYAASVIGGAAYLALDLAIGSPRAALARLARRAQLRLALAAAIAALPFLVLALVYNAVCWGSPLTTGYAPYLAAYMGENPLIGLWRMWLSPGKSVLLYSPPLILGLVALPRMWREHRAVCLVLLATAGPVLAVYSRYKLIGDYAWGPRFVVFVVPALCLGLAAVLDSWLREPPRWSRRSVLAVVLASGVAVQLLGNVLYWDHFIRISMDARAAWLGQPNRSGAIIPVRSDGHCDSCFEDVHQLELLPQFQPIRGHLWLVRAVLAGDDARRAEASAPWHDTTSLTIDISRTYERARIDWWGLLWIKDNPRTWLAGVALLLLFTAGTTAGAMAWRRAHVAPDERDELDRAAPSRSQLAARDAAEQT